MTENEVISIREQFPILNREVAGKPMIYLDNTATSQTPLSVVKERLNENGSN